RVAYNLDRPFQKCAACGKQALTMAMGFGCNAAGVVGCRIIDSPRERLLAILTNSMVPCNGRFPTLLTLLTVFFVTGAQGPLASLEAALLLTGVIVLGVGMTFAATRLLSATVLKGAPSSFTLELPPYRRPQLGRVLVRSVLDRTIFVLGRAAAVAAPAGALLWLAANVEIGGMSLLAHGAAVLDPFARLLGLDGVILIAFLFGFPANEIVLPIIVMAYTAQGTLTALGGITELHGLLLANGWTAVTALCTVFFCLLHWPCSTTLLTIRKETGSWGWTALACVLPAAFGMALCFLTACAARLIGLL
ncbi:MAG: nucleoside recognition domain-containing protein, partial [Butyricicoccus sp.]